MLYHIWLVHKCITFGFCTRDMTNLKRLSRTPSVQSESTSVISTKVRLISDVRTCKNLIPDSYMTRAGQVKTKIRMNISHTCKKQLCTSVFQNRQLPEVRKTSRYILRTNRHSEKYIRPVCKSDDPTVRQLHSLLSSSNRNTVVKASIFLVKNTSLSDNKKKILEKLNKTIRNLFHLRQYSLKLAKIFVVIQRLLLFACRSLHFVLSVFQDLLISFRAYFHHFQLAEMFILRRHLPSYIQNSRIVS